MEKAKAVAIGKRKFRIGWVAKNLRLEPFVIRFWEKEFGIKSSRSCGRQRYYTDVDVRKFFLIKDLLHKKGMTIAGARKVLCSGGGEFLGKVKNSSHFIFDKYNYAEVKCSLKKLRKKLVNLLKFL